MDEKDLAEMMKRNPELQIDASVTAVRDEPKPEYNTGGVLASGVRAEIEGKEVFYPVITDDEIHVYQPDPYKLAGRLIPSPHTLTAVGDITKAGLDFKSKTEREAWHEWLPTIEHVKAEYEPMNLKVAGANYTPDIVLLRPDGRIWFIEVKGAGGWKAYKSGRSSKRSLKQCSRYYAWLGDFYLLMKIPKKEGGGWHFEQY